MRPRIYRPHLLLRLGVAAGLVGWMLVTAVAAGLPELSLDVVLKSAGFSLFFTMLGGHYLPMEFEVTDAGVIRRTLFGERRISFSDVKAIQVLPMALMVSYGIQTRRMVMAFTSFIAGHREMLQLIAERAHVQPQRDAI